MATSESYIRFVCDQLHEFPAVSYHKMFGEYMVYVNDKPVLLVCDNTVFVKILPELEMLMQTAERGRPYPEAQNHYILDIENAELTRSAVDVLERVTPLPKPRKKKE